MRWPDGIDRKTKHSRPEQKRGEAQITAFGTNQRPPPPLPLHDMARSASDCSLMSLYIQRVTDIGYKIRLFSRESLGRALLLTLLIVSISGGANEPRLDTP